MKTVELMFGGACALALGFATMTLYQQNHQTTTCWRDPNPNRSLDFDFYTGIEGKPNRCGYLPGSGKSNLPEVIGNKAIDLDVECYPLSRIECPK